MRSNLSLQQSNPLQQGVLNTSLDVVIITPSYPPMISGNATTVSRIVEGLQKEQVSCRVFLPHELMQASINELRISSISLIHAFHAYKSGIAAQEIAARLHIPLVVTLTGTDVNVNLEQPLKRKKLLNVFKTARVIIVFHTAMQQKLLTFFPELRKKVVVIPQTVKLHEKPYALRATQKIPKKSFLFFLSAGLRRLKYHAFYLQEFVRLHELEKQYNIHLVIVGSVIEPDFARAFLHRIKPYSWIHYLPIIPHDHISAALKEADVVLNTSESEGESNNLLEAMSLGKPVLATAIPGNKAFIHDRRDGLLFSSPTSFFKRASLLIHDKILRKKIGTHAKATLRQRSYAQEITAYIRAYRYTCLRQE